MKKFIKILPLVLVLLLGFTEQANILTGGWYQQFMTNLNGRSLVDITFLDSLTGYAITSRLTNTDTSFILKTTNGGDNWTVNHTDSGFIYKRIQFINQSTGYVGGTNFIKTTNSGASWFTVSSLLFFVDMSIVNNVTAWYADPDGFVGGAYLSTNGGINWTQQLSLGSLNPDHIYMFNSRIGFVSRVNSGAPYTRRTTDGGLNWTVVVNNEAFTDMHFVDSLIGWKANFFTIEKTTNGGINWQNEIIPFGGILTTTGIQKISVLNRDTIFGGGGLAFYGGGQNRGIIYRTTNGGDNWLFQIPDTSIHLLAYGHIEFTSKYSGWAYTISGGVHTITGGDPNWLTGIKQVSNTVPKEFRLYQNFPNPFNPNTNIKYQITKNKYVLLSVYDITGKHIIDLVNQKQSAGTYQVDFSDSNLSSGVYFYSLFTDDKLIDTKKMLMIK